MMGIVQIEKTRIHVSALTGGYQKRSLEEPTEKETERQKERN